MWVLRLCGIDLRGLRRLLPETRGLFRPCLDRVDFDISPVESLFKDTLYYGLTVRANFREKIRIEISSWNERTHHHHPRANRRYSGHHRLSLEDACGRID